MSKTSNPRSGGIVLPGAKPGAAAPAPNAVPDSQPVTTPAAKERKKKEKKEKVPKVDTRITYPGLLTGETAPGPDGQAVAVRQKLTAVPTDWDPKTHHKLRPRDFDKPVLWYDFKIERAKVTVAAAEQEKADFLAGKTKPVDPDKKLNKLLTALAEIAALTGQSVDDLIAASKAKAEVAK